MSIEDKFKTFNLNDEVRVKLNQRGIDILRTGHDAMNDLWRGKLGPYRGPKIDQNGYTSFQMWEFMRIFGNTMIMGLDTPFEMNILIPERHLSDPELSPTAYKDEIKYLVEALRTAVFQMNRMGEHIRSISTDNGEMDLARTVLGKYCK